MSDFSWDNISTRTSAAANPAGGAANINIKQAAAGKRIKVYGVYLSYVRDANAADVIFQCVVSDGTGNVAATMTTTPLTANNTGLIGGSLNGSNAAITSGTDQYITLPLPDCELSPGYSMLVVFLNKQATDDCAAPRVIYKEASA